MRAVFVEYQDLAVFDVADILRADDVQRTGFRRQDRTAVELAKDERANAERIAGTDQFLIGQADK